MKIFLTGGTGLLGQYLLPALHEAGFTVRALCRNLANVPSVLKPLAEWVEGDLHDIPLLEDYVEGCTYIVHGAGKVSYHAQDKKELYQTNVEGTANLVNVALAYPIRKFLFISSIAALGRNKDALTIDENATWQETDLNTYYAKTKYLAELEVWRGMAEGLPVLVVQPSIIFGAGNWEQSSTQIFKYIWQEKRYYPEGQLSYVDVRDVAEIIVKILPTEIIEERFIVSAGEANYLELFTAIAQRFGKRPPNRIITPFLGALAWRLSAIKAFFTGSKPLISRETVMLGKNFYAYQNDKIKKTLHFEFRALTETLDWVCKELKTKELGK
jgi:nucleoside-diphosphate-sugar epimerase